MGGGGTRALSGHPVKVRITDHSQNAIASIDDGQTFEVHVDLNAAAVLDGASDAIIARFYDEDTNALSHTISHTLTASATTVAFSSVTTDSNWGTNVNVIAYRSYTSGGEDATTAEQDFVINTP